MARPRTLNSCWLIAKRGAQVSTPTIVPKLNIALLNINGLNKPKKQFELSFLCRHHQWAILALSDTRITRPQDITKIDKQFKLTIALRRLDPLG
jgi:hypothetical protein